MKKTKVISHRGGFLPEGPIPTIPQYQIPENTLEAFERAFKKDWGIETDVRLTGDNNFVVIHDSDVVRFSNISTVIDQTGISQIKVIRYISNPKFSIPTLDELFQLAKINSHTAQPPFIAFQVKRGSNSASGVKVGQAIARGIERNSLQNCIVFDATLEEAKILHQEFPWLNLSVSVGEKNYAPTIYTPTQALRREFTSVYNSVWADEWKIPGSIYNEETFKKFKSAYPGRIDVISPELHYHEHHPMAKELAKLKSLWQMIIDWGTADGICTDYPTELQILI